MPSVFDEMNEQTKKRIQHVFLMMLKHKDFNKITVRDVTTEAKINRGTFYLHYLDKYDLLKQMEQQLLGGLLLHLQALNPQRVILDAQQLQMSEFSLEVFRYMKTHSEKFVILLSKNNSSGFHLRLKGMFVERFIENYEVNRLKEIDPTIPRDYIAAFAASAILGLLEQWLASDERETPEEMVGIYMKILMFIKQV